MSEHLPECNHDMHFPAVDFAGNDMRPCICIALRACESRVRSEMEKTVVRGFTDAPEEGFQW